VCKGAALSRRKLRSGIGSGPPPLRIAQKSGHPCALRVRRGVRGADAKNGHALIHSQTGLEGDITASPLALYGLASPLAFGGLSFPAGADEAEAIRHPVGDIIYKVH